MTSPRQTPIAVIGLSALFPGSTDVQGYWQDIIAGRDCITDVPTTHWLPEDHYDPDPSAEDKIYVKRGGFLPEVDFDPMKWGVPPNVVPATDSTQLLALMVAERVLQDAWRARFNDVDRSRVSVILGVTSAQKLLSEMNSRLQRPIWVKALREMGLPESQVQDACKRIADHYTPWQENTFPGVLGNVVAGRIANRLNLGGTNCVIDAACASTLGAIKMAVDELCLEHSDVVVCGGSDTMNDPFMFTCFAKTTALSKTGDCRPFSDQADGTMLGEGVAMIALCRLADAEKHGYPIYGVLRGLGSSSDGRAKSVYAPLPAGQARALRRAYAQAGYAPDTIGLVEAHGTGTAAGDAAEFTALQDVFRNDDNASGQYCALGSVKSQIGHTKAAAGCAGIIKAVLALHHGVLPPTIKIDQPNPALELDQSPFYLNTTSRPWVHNAAHPRRASVSAFGFGGSNFHVTLEAYEKGSEAKRLPLTPMLACLLSGKAKPVLRAACDTLVCTERDEDLAYLARKSHETFQHDARHRLAIVASSPHDLRSKVRKILERWDHLEKGPLPQGAFYGSGKLETGKTAFLFPGQGSQYLGMGADLAMRFKPAQRVWDRLANLRFDEASVDQITFPPARFSETESNADAARLQRTEWAQPALAACSLSTLKLLESVNVKPDLVAGHSFGELTALSAAGVMEDETLLRVARRRGELMAEAAQVDGAMLAVSASLEDVEHALQASSCDDVEIANHNHPAQVVLSGPTASIVTMEAELRAQTFRCTRLPVATAFHSSVVRESSRPFGEFLETVPLKPPTLPVYANLTAAPYATQTNALRACLTDQLPNRVRFVEMIEAMYADGARTFVEVGAGSVLTSLTRRILKNRPHAVIALDHQGRDGVQSFVQGLAQLSALGHAVSWQLLFADERMPVDPASRAQARIAIPLTGANYGRPYPPREGAAALPAPNPERQPQESTPMSGNASDDKPSSTPSTPVGTNSAWLEAWKETQEQTAKAHMAYQQAMSEAHTAFLRASEASIRALSGQPNVANAQPDRPTLTPTPFAAPVTLEPAPSVTPPISRDVPTAPMAVTQTKSKPLTTTPVVAAPGTHVTPDLNDLLMRVVSTKTGYPIDMLDSHLELEADLGIDSIKRVEILAAIKEEVPTLPELDPAKLGALRTLGAIVEELGGAGVPGNPEKIIPPVAEPVATETADTVELSTLVMRVVSEKTGYPVDMLEPHLALESDLGIDSIKRVEILAAVKEHVPQLPDLDPARLGTLQTLGAIISELQPANDSQIESVTTAATSESTLDAVPNLGALLMEIVAEKTGYPVDMLEPGLHLESDLGIDSIKRVEILAAVKERVPSLPDLDPAKLGALQTLASIVDALGPGAGTETVVSTTTGASGVLPPAPSSRPAAESTHPLERFRIGLRARKSPGLTTSKLMHATRRVVTDDHPAIADALVTCFASRGLRLEKVHEVPADADVVIGLYGLGRGSDNDASRAMKRAFRDATTIAPRFETDGGLFITVQDTGGDFGHAGTARAHWGALPGLVKTAALEWPSATVRALDIAQGQHKPTELADILASEILEGGIDREVAIDASGRRTVPTLVREPVSPSSKNLSPPTVVASGGARGVTAACITQMAKAFGGRYLLLGRSPLTLESEATRDVGDEDLQAALLESARAAGEKLTPRELSGRKHRLLSSREIQRTLETLVQLGAEAHYASVDVCEAEAVARVVAERREQWGAFSHVVHGAGVLADRKIAEKTGEDFERVYRTKVDGLQHLLAATKEDDLRSITLFSSVAAHFGNVGQADYAMANTTLDQIATREASCRQNCTVRSLAWGPWEGGMVTPGLAAHFHQRGIALIPITQGSKAFVTELQWPEGPRVLIGQNKPLVSSTTQEATFAVHVDAQSHPYLGDHTVDSKPVLPLVVVLDWFARAGRAIHPTLEVARVRELQVLRGIQLDQFRAHGHAFDITLRLRSNGKGAIYTAELRDDTGIRYRACVDLVDSRPLALPTPPAPTDLKTREGHLYGGCLFHGEAFQVIRHLHGVDHRGASGDLVGVSAKAWKNDAWETDPALLDGGLQLAVLWTEHELHGAALPTGLDALHLYRSGPLKGSVQAHVFGHESRNGRARCDVVFLDAQGDLVAQLSGVETCVRPSTLTSSDRSK